MPKERRPVVLAIGGSDSSGGAGIGRDLRTLAGLNIDGIAVVTAVTAQTHARVLNVHHVPPSLIRDQLNTTLASNPVSAIKIGMLGTRHAVEAVAATLPWRSGIPIVLDPVLAASSGSALLDEEGSEALTELLLPRVSVVTPNIPEVASILGMPCSSDLETLTSYGRRLLDLGVEAVLIKGGHANGSESVDLLFAPEYLKLLPGPRLPGSVRGTGCALASAIAAGLAYKMALPAACLDAKRHVAGLFG